MSPPFTEIVFGSEYIDQGPVGGLLRLAGELDLACIPNLERALLEANGQRTLVLDLRDLHFIDCASLGTIFREANRYRREGRRFALNPGTSPIQRVLRAVKADNWVEIVSEAGDADQLESLPSSSPVAGGV